MVIGTLPLGDVGTSRLRHTGVRLAEIDAALARHGKGSYGRCETCGMPIDPERLEVLPAARQCIGCALRSRSSRW
ncbi:hypothetical protein FOB84_00850 [Gordonia bronchialis]|nr:hypothetical protein FOB84_00850 [Gordonia bronchialis]